MPHDIVHPAIQGHWMRATRTPGDSAVFDDSASTAGFGPTLALQKLMS